MSMTTRHELIGPDFAGPPGCRVCRGALNTHGAHALPPATAHRAAPAWETIGYTTRGRAVLATIPHWREVPGDGWDDELAPGDGWGTAAPPTRPISG